MGADDEQTSISTCCASRRATFSPDGARRTPWRISPRWTGRACSSTSSLAAVVGWRPVEATVIAEELGRAGELVDVARLRHGRRGDEHRRPTKSVTAGCPRCSMAPATAGCRPAGDVVRVAAATRSTSSSPWAATESICSRWPTHCRGCSMTTCWTSAARRGASTVSGAPEHADRVDPNGRTSCSPSPELLLSADSVGAAVGDLRAADRLPEGAHRVRCADREFPSGATSTGGSAGLRGEGSRGHHEGRRAPLAYRDASDDARGAVRRGARVRCREGHRGRRRVHAAVRRHRIHVGVPLALRAASGLHQRLSARHGALRAAPLLAEGLGW